MRAIDADALKKELAPYEENDFSQQIDVILKIVDAQPTLTPPNEWVSVEERLPEIGGSYLCVWQGRKIDTGFFLNGHFRLYGEIKDHLITHWMPLPAPPDRRPPEGEV